MNRLIKTTLILYLLTFSFYLYSQTNNLVMNPGFEEDSFCTDLGDGIWSGCAKYWTSPSYQGPYYFNICSNEDTSIINDTRTPYNIFGYSFPHNGIAYVGFGLYSQLGDGHSARQYIQGTLVKPLVNNKYYGVKYYLSLGETLYGGPKKFCIDNVGFAFYNNKIYYDTLDEELPLTPQYQNTIGNVLSVSNGWQKVEGSFMASGGERYFTIGNFQNNANTRIYDCFMNGAGPMEPGELGYYIDDISVIDTSLTDTVQLCMNDSIYLQGAWRKGAGMYYDTVAGMPYRKYINPVSYASTHTLQHYIGKPGVDSFKTAYFWSRIFAGKDTTFRVTMPSVYGCDSIIICRLQDSSTVGISEPNTYTNEASLLIYPNPSSEFINLKIYQFENEKSENLKIIVYDFMGQEVGLRFRQAQSTSPMTGGGVSYQLDISKLSSGMYFVRVIDKKNKFVGSGKFVKSNSF